MAKSSQQVKIEDNSSKTRLSLKTTNDPEIKCAGGENLFIGNLASLNEFSLYDTGTIVAHSECVFLLRSTVHTNPAEIH